MPLRRRIPQRRVQRFVRPLALLIGLASAGMARATDWPQFLGPTRDGVYAGGDLAPAWSPAGPRVVWTRDAGHGFAGPVVAGGRAVLFHRVGDNEVVACLDANTGEPKWSAEYPTAYVDDFGFDPGPRATPAVEGGRVFTYGADGQLHAWELGTGKALWSVDARKTLGAGKGYFGAACSPLVEGDAVILNVGGGDGAGVVAFDKASGKVLWRATDDAASYSAPVAATVDGKRYAFVFTRAGLVALEPADGKVCWRFPWRARMDASVNAATPLVVGDRIFVSASYDTGAALLRFAPDTPVVLWSGDESMSNHYATCVHRDGFLYGFHGRQEQRPSLRCVELATGKVRWSEDDFGAGTVTLAGGSLLVLTEKGQLIAAPATPDGYKPAARAQVLPFEVRAHPAVANGHLFARSKDKLVCVDLRAAK